jgi:DNA gyrase/topoisomerase IV subunit A
MYANAPERIVQLRSEQTPKTDREKLKTQLQALEAQIKEHIDLIKKQQDEAQRRRQELQEEPEDEEDGGAQRALAIQEVEKQSGLLEADQTSSTVVFSQVHSKRTGQDIVNIITSDNSKALVGMPESVVGAVNQRIKDVTTQNMSAAAVGVFDKNVDMRNFFKPS